MKKSLNWEQCETIFKSLYFKIKLFFRHIYLSNFVCLGGGGGGGGGKKEILGGRNFWIAPLFFEASFFNEIFIW